MSETTKSTRARDQAEYRRRERSRLARLETRIDAITLAIAMMLEAHKEEQRNAADGLL